MPLQKWYEGFGEFSWKDSKVSKLALWWVPLVESILMYELKDYRGVMCNDTEGWCKFWTGIDLSLEKWGKEIGEFWTEHLK